MRARRTGDPDAAEGETVAPFERQDSSLLSVFAAADALLVRPPNDPPRAAGAAVEIIPLGEG
jgi:molybdopterin molybdotransferase